MAFISIGLREQWQRRKRKKKTQIKRTDWNCMQSDIRQVLVGWVNVLLRKLVSFFYFHFFGFWRSFQLHRNELRTCFSPFSQFGCVHTTNAFAPYIHTFALPHKLSAWRRRWRLQWNKIKKRNICEWRTTGTHPDTTDFGSLVVTIEKGSRSHSRVRWWGRCISHFSEKPMMNYERNKQTAKKKRTE